MLTAAAATDRAAVRAAGRFAIPLVIAVSAGLGAIGITRSYGLAETEVVASSRDGWSGLVPFRDADPSGVLYHVLVRPWLRPSTPEWVARIPSLVAVALAVALVCLLAARLLDRTGATVAGLLFGVGAAAAGTAGTAGPLALATLLVTAATLLLVLARERESAALWGAYAVVAALAVYAHASASLVLPAHAVALVVAGRASRRAWAAVAVAAAAAAPAVAVVAAQARHHLEPLPQPSLADLGRAFDDASGHNVALLALALAGAGWLAYARARAAPETLPLLAGWALGPAAGTLILSVARPSLAPAYLAVSLPALALLGAAAATAAGRREVAAATLAAVLAVGAVWIVRSDHAPPESWRAATEFALRHRPDGGVIVVTPPRALTAFAHYAGPDRGARHASGPEVLVVVRARSDAAAIAVARRAVRAPAYALLSDRSFGRLLHVQRWERTGLPSR